MTPSATAEGREHALEHVERGVEAFQREDPRLTPAEKETTLRFDRDDDRAKIYTAERGIGRRLLAHPHATIDGVTLKDGNRRPEAALEELEKYDDPTVVGVRASVPVAAITIKRDPRKTGDHALFVAGSVLERVDP